MISPVGRRIAGCGERGAWEGNVGEVSSVLSVMRLREGLERTGRRRGACPRTRGEGL